MTKMNMGDRVAITKQIMQKVYGPKLAASAKAIQKASEEAYKALYAQDLRKINRLPDGWLPTSSSFSFRYDGEYHRLHFSKSARASVNVSRDYNVTINSDSTASESVHRRFLYAHDRNTPTIDPKAAYYESFGALVNLERAHDALTKELTRDAKEVMNVLRGMTTIEAVQDKWPEVKIFISKAAVTPTPGTALAPNFAALNERLGL